jgi:hypothetical protein
MLTEEEEILDIVRLHNKTLRTVNKKARKRVQQLQADSDRLFTELCTTNDSAVLAMEKLAEFGGFEVCPENYDHVVESYITAMKIAYDTLSDKKTP